MTIKSLLSSVSLALLLSGAAVTAQAQIAIGQLADYSGGTSDVGTPYGQGVADAFAWVNKNGGIGGKPVSVDTVDYGYQVPKAVALYKKWSSPDSKVAAIMGTLMGTAFVVVLPESMEWISASLKGSAIDRALSLNNNITFLREISIGSIIIVFLMFEPDGLAHRWRQIKTYWKLYPFSH